MSRTSDIVVVGGGVIGCAVVQHLAALLPRDTRITLLDRGAIAGGTSGSSQGHLMVTPDCAQEYAFTHTSVRLWADLQEQEGGFDYNPTGALYIADDPADVELFATLRDQFRACGDDAQVLDAKQLREVEPGLARDLPGGVFYPGDGVVLPMPGCAAMLRVARRNNPHVEVLSHTAVTGFEVSGGRIEGVRTVDGVIATRNVVNAAGVWSPDLAAMAGQPRLPVVPRAGNLAITAHHASPIRTQILEVSYLRVAHGAPQADPLRTDQDTGAHAVNMQPQTNGGCLIGSTRQFQGMKRTVNPELLRRSLQRAARYVPALASSPLVRTWVGLRPYSLDKHPLIGPWPGLEGMWVATGHEGLGITLCQVTGLLLAQQFAGTTPSVDVKPYLPARVCA